MSGYLDQRAELRDESAKLAVLEQKRDTLREQIADLEQGRRAGGPRAGASGSIKPGERAFIVRGDLEPQPAADEGDGDDGGPLGWLTGIF